MEIIEYLGIYFPYERWNRWADMGFLIVAAGFTLIYASLPELRRQRLLRCNHASMSGKCRFQCIANAAGIPCPLSSCPLNMFFSAISIGVMSCTSVLSLLRLFIITLEGSIDLWFYLVRTVQSNGNAILQRRM